VDIFKYTPVCWIIEKRRRLYSTSAVCVDFVNIKQTGGYLKIMDLSTITDLSSEQN